MKESRENFVDLKAFTTTIGIEQMIEFSYTGIIKITFDTIISLLDAASYFQINEALTLINDYLIQKCTEKNSVNILKLADRFSLYQVKQYLAKYFVYNIMKAEEATYDCRQIDEEDRLSYVKNAFLVILVGKHANKYAQLLSFNDGLRRIIVKLVDDNQTFSVLPKCTRLVSKSEVLI